MPEIHLKNNEFPALIQSDLSKREMAVRASIPASLDTVRRAYDIIPAKVRRFSALYFVVPDGEEVCKIGISHNPFRRICDLKGSCWKPLSIKALFWYTNINYAQSHEQAALALAKKEQVRLTGEWLALDYMESIGLVLCEADNRVFTDSHGLVSEWFPELKRQSDQVYDRIFSTDRFESVAKVA